MYKYDYIDGYVHIYIYIFSYIYIYVHTYIKQFIIWFFFGNFVTYLDYKHNNNCFSDLYRNITLRAIILTSRARLAHIDPQATFPGTD